MSEPSVADPGMTEWLLAHLYDEHRFGRPPEGTPPAELHRIHEWDHARRPRNLIDHDLTFPELDPLMFPEFYT